MDNKDKIFATACDDNNFKYAVKVIRSFRYFHPDIPIVIFTTVAKDTAEKELPEGVRVEPITTDDKDIWYKQKPYFGNILFNEGYKRILMGDADMLILGDISYMFDTSADVGTVLNFNPVDFRAYGPVTVGPIHYATEYFNCGLVMMKNHKMVKHWLKLCNGAMFPRLRYREQDLLNLILYFGEYEHECFDDYTSITGHAPAWHGLLASSETMRAELRDKHIVIPANPENQYPHRDVLFKVWHAGGGQTPHDKLNYRVKFSEPVVERINEILK